ncbi:MAG: radical SAM protein [Firmicutes bacterium]|nr:radical SAM protein [Bacillota bacterium]
MNIKTIESKSALNKSGIGGVDYVINPYVGCAHACVYCYADFMRRFTGHEGEVWGTFVDVKTNIVERLKREIFGRIDRSRETRLRQPGLPGSLPGLSSFPPGPPSSAHPAVPHSAVPRPATHRARYTGEIMFSSVTDPYQPLEAEWRLTRGCLESLLAVESMELAAESGEVEIGTGAKPGPRPGAAGPESSPRRARRAISILTKSDLVTRDIDILKDFQDCTVGLTITTARDEVARIFEPGAPSPSRRLAALEKLNEAGIKTWVFMAPVLPYFSDRPEEMELLFKAVAAAGTQEISMDPMNFYPSVKYRMSSLFDRVSQSGNRTSAGHTGGEHAGALAYLNKVMRDPEGWRIDIKAGAHKAADKYGIHMKFAF